MAEGTVVNTAGAVAAIIYERMLSITVANGYETNMGLQVFQGKTRVADEQIVGATGENVDTPAVSVLEGIDTIEGRPGRIPNVLVEQRYGLVGYSRCDPSAPNEAAHRLLRDLKRAIWRGNGDFDGQVISVKYLSRDIGPRSDGVNIVMALVEIGVRYVEDLTKP